MEIKSSHKIHLVLIYRVNPKLIETYTERIFSWKRNGNLPDRPHTLRGQCPLAIPDQGLIIYNIIFLLEKEKLLKHFREKRDYCSRFVLLCFRLGSRSRNPPKGGRLGRLLGQSECLFSAWHQPRGSVATGLLPVTVILL